MNLCRENNEKIFKSVCFSDFPSSIIIQFTYCGGLLFFSENIAFLWTMPCKCIWYSVHVYLNTDVSAYSTFLVSDFLFHPGKRWSAFQTLKQVGEPFLLAWVIALPIFTGKLLAYSYAAQYFRTLEPNEIMVGVFSRQAIIIQFIIWPEWNRSLPTNKHTWSTMFSKLLNKESCCNGVSTRWESENLCCCGIHLGPILGII